jgi:hypothetical protein
VAYHQRIKAGTGIEPVNSGFADRGLTTWLPRRFRLLDLIRETNLVSHRLRLVAIRGRFSKTMRTSAHAAGTVTHRSVRRQQGVRSIPGRVQSQRARKAGLKKKTTRSLREQAA